MIKYIAFSLVLLTSLLLVKTTTHAQVVSAQRTAISVRAVPPIVVENFQKKYSDVMVKGWYTTHEQYWAFDMSSGWYSGWYGERSSVVYYFSKPNFYEVEFMDEPGTLSRSLYNKFGIWYETRTKQRGLLHAQKEALLNSPYGGWRQSDLVERIDSAVWPEPVYRFHVSKGRNSVILRMNEQGDIIQEKRIADL